MSGPLGGADFSTLGDIVSVWAKRRPGTLALVSGDRVWNWADLNAEANQVAHALAGEGLGPGDRVAYLGKNAPEFFPLLYGATRVGVVVVGVNWRLTTTEMATIIVDSESTIVFVGEEFSAHLNACDLPPRVRGISLGKSSERRSFPEWLEGRPTKPLDHRASPDDTCLQLYSSGTTGIPKGIELSHRSILSQLRPAASGWHLDDTSVNLVCMPLYHIAGSGNGLAGAYAGATTVLIREVDLDGILRAILEHRVTNVLLVPTVIHSLITALAAATTDFSSLRCIVYGASPISDEVLRRALSTFGRVLVQAYGSTETAGGFTCLAIEDHDPERPELLRSCGKPWEGAEIRIVDTKTGAPLPDGQVGEILVRTPQIMTGYWGRPNDTAEAMTSDGFFRTGDGGSLRDGYLYIQDRLKDMVITGGENVYPAEVENVLMSHPGVADCAVIGVPDEQWGEKVMAVVVRADRGLEPGSLISWCRERLAHFKCPKMVEWVDDLPRNPSGKVLKRILREHWGAYSTSTIDGGYSTSLTPPY